ncbi:MAG: hypothetical protein GY774_10905 [Planctomycetes bacterium]|nr:hypothetical protein [Planctomycetota bacterium]
MRSDTDLLDYLESISLTIYTSDDPEPEKKPKHYTLVNESKKPRTGSVASTLREAINIDMDKM